MLQAESMPHRGEQEREVPLEVSHRCRLERLLLSMISKVGARRVLTSATTAQPKREATPQQQPANQRYADSFFAAQDVGASVRRFTQLLGDPPLTTSFGAREQWAAVDEAAQPSTSKTKKTSTER